MADSCNICGRITEYCAQNKDTCVPPRTGFYYNPKALNATVAYISEHNRHFRGDDDFIRHAILEAVVEVAAFEGWNHCVSNMGFTVRKISNSRYIRIYLDMSTLHCLNDDEDVSYIEDNMPKEKPERKTIPQELTDKEFVGMMGTVANHMPKRKQSRVTR